MNLATYALIGVLVLIATIVLTPVLIVIGVLLGIVAGLVFGVGGPIVMAFGYWGNNTKLGQLTQALHAAERLGKHRPEHN